MPQELIVVQAFGPYKVGDRITDASHIKRVLDSAQRAFVVAAKQGS